MTRTLIAIVLAAAVTAGCNSSSSISTPHHPAPQKMYVVTFNSVAGTEPVGLEVFDPPFTASETAAVQVLDGAPSNLDAPGDIAVDHAGSVYTINDVSTSFITGYTHPVSSSSAPFAQFTAVSGGNNTYGMTFDPSGNLWFSDRATGDVYEVAPPFTNASVPTLVLSAPNGVAANGSNGLAFDAAGDLAVAEQVQDNVLVYTAPVTNASAVSATLSLPSNGQGVAFDSSGRLYATSTTYGGAGTGSILIFAAPFTTGESPTATIVEPNSANGGLSHLKFDASGNLWVPLCGTFTGVDEYTSPFTSASTPALSMNMAAGTVGCIYGVAFGP